MFDEFSQHDFDEGLEVGDRRSVPREHAADPFACPCCANVFRLVLEKTGTDLGARQPGEGARPRQRNALIVNARITTMNPEAPEADATT